MTAKLRFNTTNTKSMLASQGLDERTLLRCQLYSLQCLQFIVFTNEL